MVRLARSVRRSFAAQSAYLVWDISLWRTLPDGILACHAGDILADCLVLALTFADRSWLARLWRSLVFVSCSAVFAGMAATSVITKKSGSLFVACMLLIVASGSTIPWE